MEAFDPCGLSHRATYGINMFDPSTCLSQNFVWKGGVWPNLSREWLVTGPKQDSDPESYGDSV